MSENKMEIIPSSKKPINTRLLEGVVVSNNMQKTIVVRVDRTIMHPKYKKRYTQSKRYKVHDENNEAIMGEKVTFFACRPISKDKRWCLVKKESINLYGTS